ncbi:MAG TPA: restriction endonuclease [Tepidisphaeraceae bacterium]|jgi:hypothetical protein|nr:restriction endonuclease [Tepidisphaeraceae bacterium]
MAETQSNPQTPALSLEFSTTGTKCNHLDALIRLEREAESRAYMEELRDRRRRIVMDYSRTHHRSKELEAELAPTMLSAEELAAWKERNHWIAVPGPEMRRGIEAEKRLAPEAATFDDRMNAVLLKHANVPYGLAGQMVMSDYWQVLDVAANSVEQAAYPGTADARKRYAIGLRGCTRDLQGGGDNGGRAMQRAIGTLKLSLKDGTLGLWSSCQELIDFVGMQSNGKSQPVDEVSSDAWHFIWDYAVVSRLRQVLPQRFAGVPDYRPYRADENGCILDDRGQTLAWTWDGKGSGMLNGEACLNLSAGSALKQLLTETGMDQVYERKDWADTYRDTPEYRAAKSRMADIERGTGAVACEAMAEFLEKDLRFRHPRHIAPIKWEEMDDDAFERFVFNLVSNVPSYTNVRWLTQTRAPDRGRDLSANRTSDDPITGRRELRIIFQCKHWLSHSIGIKEITVITHQMDLWSPPPLDELVIVTSGRFATDAVQWIEKHNFERKNPRIVMCPNSQLESLASA